MSRHPRSIAPSDRRRIRTELERGAATLVFERLRTRALVYLAWGSALRLNECTRLNVAQLLEAPKTSSLAIRSMVWLRTDQAKGRREPAKGQRQWSSAGYIVVTKRARAALRDYLRACITRGWLQLPAAANTPLFLATHGFQESGRKRLSDRSAQHCWHRVQARAGVAEPYHFHCLRHDAATLFAQACDGDVFKVARFARFSVSTAQRYVHVSPTAVSELAELASRSS